jgi:hypothetical protein
MPLSAMPSLNWIGGYEIGYAIQEAGTAHEIQHVALAVTGVPHPPPIQPYNHTPSCASVIGAVGDIVAVPVALQFEGSGLYTVSVSVGPSSGSSSDCLTPGPATASATGSFTGGAAVVPAVVGTPMAFRAKPLTSTAFVGVRAADPPGGTAETRCARNATINADGSVTGSLLAPASADDNDGGTGALPEAQFTRPGAWTCVARGGVDGVDSAFSTLHFATPWSAPLHLDVRADFERVLGKIITKRHARHPRIRFTAQFPDAAAGGAMTFKLRQAVGCRSLGHRRYAYRFGSTQTAKARFDAKGATVTLKAPHTKTFSADRFFIGTLSFGGTRFITKSVDPNPSLIEVTSAGGFQFGNPNAAPQCPGGFS